MMRRNESEGPESTIDSATGGSTRRRSHQQQSRNIDDRFKQFSENPKHYVTIQGDTYALSPYTTESLTFWGVLAILIFLVAANSILTFTILGSLRFGSGMESIEFLSNALKFFGNADFNEVNKLDGILQGFDEDSIEIAALESGRISFLIHDQLEHELSIDKSSINFTEIHDFKVTSFGGEELLSITKPSFDLSNDIENLRVELIKVNRITSGINSTLEFLSSSTTHLKGAEGTQIDGKSVQFSADRDIILNATRGDILLGGQKGISIYVDSLAIVDDAGVTRHHHTYPTQGKKHNQYKLCICMPKGKIFKIEVQSFKNEARKITCNSIAFNCN